MKPVQIDINNDDLSWLEERIRNSFTQEHRVIFGKITDTHLEVDGRQQPRKTIGACRFFMTRKLSDEPHQLLIIGMNPSNARDFIGTTKGEYRETDRTASTVYEWINDGAYDSLPKLGRITLINLVPLIDGSHKKIGDKPDELKTQLHIPELDSYLKRVLEAAFSASISNFPGTTHIVCGWGKEKGREDKWKIPYVDLLDQLIFTAPHRYAWQIRPKSGEIKPFPPHPRWIRDFADGPDGLISYNARIERPY